MRNANGNAVAALIIPDGANVGLRPSYMSY